ncbi:hypothetical protein HY989_06960 [Candidatus Micrarchaeota archaeon]|nr:hypothetical protein [Candidatus Micrarchaeota archaeon]
MELTKTTSVSNLFYLIKDARSPDEVISNVFLPIIEGNHAELGTTKEINKSRDFASIIKIHNKENPKESILIDLGVTERRTGLKNKKYSLFNLHVDGVDVPLKDDFRRQSAKFGYFSVKHPGKEGSISHKLNIPLELFSKIRHNVSRTNTGDRIVHLDVSENAFGKIKKYSVLNVIKDYLRTAEYLGDILKPSRFGKQIKTGNFENEIPEDRKAFLVKFYDPEKKNIGSLITTTFWHGKAEMKYKLLNLMLLDELKDNKTAQIDEMPLVNSFWHKTVKNGHEAIPKTIFSISKKIKENPRFEPKAIEILKNVLKKRFGISGVTANNYALNSVLSAKKNFELLSQIETAYEVTYGIAYKENREAYNLNFLRNIRSNNRLWKNIIVDPEVRKEFIDLLNENRSWELFEKRRFGDRIRKIMKNSDIAPLFVLKDKVETEELFRQIITRGKFSDKYKKYNKYENRIKRIVTSLEKNYENTISDSTWSDRYWYLRLTELLERKEKASKKIEEYKKNRMPK